MCVMRDKHTRRSTLTHTHKIYLRFIGRSSSRIIFVLLYSSADEHRKLKLYRRTFVSFYLSAHQIKHAPHSAPSYRNESRVKIDLLRQNRFSSIFFFFLFLFVSTTSSSFKIYLLFGAESREKFDLI